MPQPVRFQLEFAPEVVDQLRVIERKYHGLIQRAIDEQLTFTPETETRNRKPLEQPAPGEATWELRFGPGNRFRVFYEVAPDRRAVRILAVGFKQGSRLVIGGEEFEL